MSLDREAHPVIVHTRGSNAEVVWTVSKEQGPESVFDILGNEVAWQILALASLKPLSAAEPAGHCGVSESTIYRRIRALQEYDILDEQLRLDDEGHRYKRFRTSLKEARFQVDEGRFDIGIQLKKDYSDKFPDLWNDLEKRAKEVSNDTTIDSRHCDSSSSGLSGG